MDTCTNMIDTVAEKYETTGSSYVSEQFVHQAQRYYMMLQADSVSWNSYFNHYVVWQHIFISQGHTCH